MAIRLYSPGPAFYRCRRVGLRGGVLYMLLKFRKMHDGAAPSCILRNLSMYSTPPRRPPSTTIEGGPRAIEPDRQRQARDHGADQYE